MFCQDYISYMDSTLQQRDVFVRDVLPINRGKKILSNLLSNNDTRLELTDKIKPLQFTSEVSVN